MSESEAGQVTRLLVAWSGGDRSALDQLTPLVYGELRRLAAAYIRRERRDHTLQPTALVHEAYLRLVNQGEVQSQSRTQFFAIAANLMRQILVNHAKRHRASKRGSGRKEQLQEAAAVAQPQVDLLALNEALEKLAALDPRYGFGYLFGHGWTGFLVLGGVFLCATGAEALYADMGHFGPQPIRLAWYALVLPTLLLNYAGQAAVVVDGEVAADANPFFALCPSLLQVPLVALATAATIIASQAIISGTFSMTRQAIQLGLCPRLHITQTSSEGYGQIYVGFVNWTLMVLTLGLALSFRSSDNLASAFGIAVALTMLLTSLLMFIAMREVWGWSLPLSIAVAGLFVIVDLSFVAANMMKVIEGGWVPLVVGATLYFIMSTWRQGRAALARKLERDTLPLKEFIAQVHSKARVTGTAVYMTSRVDVVPVPLLHNLKHNKVLHERIVLLHVVTRNIPRVAPDKRVEVVHLGDNFHSVVAYYGFMQHPNVPRVLERCSSQGLHFNMMETSFFVGRVTIMPARKSRYWALRCKLFEAMHRNALAATEFFRIPPDRVIELGAQVEI